MLLGWNPEVSLQMPARRFFSILEAAQELKSEKDRAKERIRVITMRELVEVALAGQCTIEGVNKIRKAFDDQLAMLDPNYQKPQPLPNKVAFAQFNYLQNKVKRRG